MLFEVKNQIPGFEDVTSVEIDELDNFFVRMTTKDRDPGKEQVSLTLVNPYSIRRDYDFVLPTSLQLLIEANDDSELRVYNVVVLNKTIEDSVVNFLAPIVVNMKNKTLCQAMLDPAIYVNYGQAEKIGVIVQKNIFEVKGSILGFEDIRKVQITPIDQFLATMSSKESSEEHKNTSFTLINPYILRPEYDFVVPTPYQVLLDVKNPDELVVFNLVILNKTIEDSGVNFLAPIVCNLKNNTLAQVVLDPKNYPYYGPAERVGDFIKDRK